jgi:hypothetical protein
MMGLAGVIMLVLMLPWELARLIAVRHSPAPSPGHVPGTSGSA